MSRDKDENIRYKSQNGGRDSLSLDLRPGSKTPNGCDEDALKNLRIITNDCALYSVFSSILWDKVMLGNSVWTGTHYVAKADPNS